MSDTELQPPAFERDTSYRILTEAVRHWLVTRFLAGGMPKKPAVFWVYSNGPNGIDWGDDPKAPTQDRPLKGKRIRVTFEVENY